jgi:hypothetical protein
VLLLCRMVPGVPVGEVDCDDTVSRDSVGSSTRGSLVAVGEVTRVVAVCVAWFRGFSYER